jgi:two-component system sensor histidine kinase HydH
MKETYIPEVRYPFKLSKPAMAVILAATLLAVILAVTTLRNIHREQQLMEDFLLSQGLTLIRTFEAGARTSFMHQMMESNPLDTLVTETAAEESIAYIRIVDEHGHLISEAGKLPVPVEIARVKLLLNQDQPVTALNSRSGVFEIGGKFAPLPPLMPAKKRMSRRLHHFAKSHHDRGGQLIFIGFLTREFAAARQQDVRHTIFMGALLFLLGSCGLYFLFLYQEMRISRATLATMRRYTENVIESMPDGLLTLDVESKIISCNSKAEELLGHTQTEIEGKEIESILSPFPIKQLQQQKELLEQLVVSSQEGGEEMAMKISASQLLDPEGKRMGTVLMLRDMREIRRMEKQLERARRMAALGGMAAGIAHEIRNPLGTLRGFAQFFGSQAEKKSESRQYADLMVSEVDRLNQTISGLLQFARPREPNIIQIDVERLFRKTEQLMQADFNGHSVSLQIEYADNRKDIKLSADPDLLLQVLLNLLKNAINASSPGGKVILKIWQDEQTVRIQVRDNGQGMDKEEQERMFDPFFTTRKKGTGLGLAVSHQIIEQHDGCFEVQSTPEKGTAITIILPHQ